MKKTRARFLSMLLSVCMMVSLLPTVAFGAEGNQDSGVPLGVSGAKAEPPTISALTVEPTTLPSTGGWVTVTMTGTNLPSALFCKFEGNTSVGNSDLSTGSSTQQSAQLLISRNTSTTDDLVVTIKAWPNGLPIHEGHTATVTVARSELPTVESPRFASGGDLPDTKSVVLGSTLTLSVEMQPVNADETLSYEWYKDDVRMNEAADSDTLEFDNFADTDAGRYYVIVYKNKEGYNRKGIRSETCEVTAAPETPELPGNTYTVTNQTDWLALTAAEGEHSISTWSGGSHVINLPTAQTLEGTLTIPTAVTELTINGYGSKIVGGIICGTRNTDYTPTDLILNSVHVETKNSIATAFLGGGTLTTSGEVTIICLGNLAEGATDGHGLSSTADLTITAGGPLKIQGANKHTIGQGDGIVATGKLTLAGGSPVIEGGSGNGIDIGAFNTTGSLHVTGDCSPTIIANTQDLGRHGAIISGDIVLTTSGTVTFEARQPAYNAVNLRSADNNINLIDFTGKLVVKSRNGNKAIELNGSNILYPETLGENHRYDNTAAAYTLDMTGNTPSNTYTISGSVTDGDTNAAIEGASVQLKNSSGNVGSPATTDSSGNYTITGVLPGDYTIEFSKSGYTTGTMPSFEVSSANITDKNLAMALAPATYTVSGTVTDGSTNLGLAGASVQLLNYYGNSVGNPVTTDNSGSYTILNVGNEATYETVASKSGYTKGNVFFQVNGADVTGKDIALQPINTTDFILKLGDTTLNATATIEVSGNGYSYIYNDTTNTGTLTLTDYSNGAIGRTTDSGGIVIQSALFANFPLVLVLEGNNRLDGFDATDADSVGIYMDDDAPLTIKGNGKLYAVGGTAGDAGWRSIGISALGLLTIESGAIVAVGGIADEPSAAIDANDIIVTGGSLTANGVEDGLECADLTVSGDSIVNATADVNGINARGTLTVSDNGSVTGEATGSVTDLFSVGIQADDFVLNDNATVTGIGGDISRDEGGSYGIYADRGITVNGGTLRGEGGTATGTKGQSFGVYLPPSNPPKISGGVIIGIAGTGTTVSAGLSDKSQNSNTVLYVSENRDGSELKALPFGEEVSDYPYAVNYIPTATNGAFFRDGVRLSARSDSIKIPTENASTIRYQFKNLDQIDMPMDTAVTWGQGGTMPNGVTAAQADASGIPITVTAGASTGSFGLIAQKQGTSQPLATLTVNIVDKVDVSSSISFANGTATYTGRALLSQESASFNGTESGTGRFTFTYDVPIGSTGDLDSNGRPVGAGVYNVTAVYEDDTQRGEKTATFTVNKATPVITGVSVVNTPIYTTSVVILNHTDAFAGSLIFDNGQVLTVGTKDYNWTFTPTDTENYNNETGTVSVTVVEDTITSLTVTAPPTKTTYKHGETLDKTGLVLTATHTSGATTTLSHNDITVTYQNGNAFVAGDNAVTFGYGGLTATQAVTVNKADYTGIKTATGTVLAAGQTGATVTLPALPEGADYGTPGDGGGDITMRSMSVSGTTLTYTVLASTAGQIGTIIVPATGASHYNDYNVTVTVSSTDKQLQDISYAVGAVSKTYGDIYFTNPLTETTVDGEITYASDNTAVATVNASTGEVTIKSAGSAIITATAAETTTHAQATASYTVTVAKSDLIVKPRDYSIKSNQSMPTFSVITEGSSPPNLVPTNPDAIAMQAQENGVPLTTVKVGVFDIVFTTAPTFADAIMKNHNIIYKKGTLTVTQYSSGGSSSGGGGSTGGGDNTTVTTPPATTENPNPPTEATVTVKPAVSGDTVSATVSQKTVDNAIAKAQTEAKKNGTTANGITVEIKVDTKNTQAENINTSLPKESVDALVKAGARELRITSEIADISLDLHTLKEIQKQVGADISVSAKKVDNSTLSAEAQKIVGERPVYDFSITGKNGKKITDFGNGKVSVSIPYTLSANENAANVIAYYIDSTGKLTEMPNSVYDPVTQTLSFVTDHFSKFAVGYKVITVNFTDITNHWAKDNIEFVVARGILAGTGDGKFAPNNAMTRGMFVTALGRLAEVETKGYTKSSFTDVAADVYYMPYVEWASKNGIVSGVGNGKFAPDASITREQMAVIMQNYAKAIGFNLPKVHAENSFVDSVKISTWAKDAVKSMQMAGVLAGKNGNLFDPQGTATRAEVSAVLKRFVELAISTDSAEGWTVNDSGKWMYYENGKAVTGKKNIDGTTYTFDQYGVTADVPKNRKTGIYVVQQGDSFWLIAYKQGCTIKELELLNGKSRFSLIHPGDELIVLRSNVKV